MTIDHRRHALVRAGGHLTLTIPARTFGVRVLKVLSEVVGRIMHFGQARCR
jgi:hypothetical protein